MAATGDLKANWTGLLNSGTEYAEAARQLAPVMAQHCREWMDNAATADGYLEVATTI